MVALLTISALGIAADVPPATKASFILHVLSYNRTLSEHPRTGLGFVAIVYREGSSESEAERIDISSALEDAGQRFSVAGMRIRAFKVPFRDAATLESDLARENFIAVYVCSGLSDNLAELSKVAQRQHLLSLTGVESYVRSGLSVGIIRRGSRPALLVNLAQSRAEGADLETPLLRIAEVLQ